MRSKNSIQRRLAETPVLPHANKGLMATESELGCRVRADWPFHEKQNLALTKIPNFFSCLFLSVRRNIGLPFEGDWIEKIENGRGWLHLSPDLAII